LFVVVDAAHINLLGFDREIGPIAITSELRYSILAFARLVA
jgi:hypothetical protein